MGQILKAEIKDFTSCWNASRFRIQSKVEWIDRFRELLERVDGTTKEFIALLIHEQNTTAIVANPQRIAAFKSNDLVPRSAPIEQTTDCAPLQAHLENQEMASSHLESFCIDRLRFSKVDGYHAGSVKGARSGVDREGYVQDSPKEASLH